MRVTVRAVKDLARNAGVPEDIVERHIDALVAFTFTVALRERKSCRRELREWLYTDKAERPDLKELLKVTEESEAHDVI